VAPDIVKPVPVIAVSTAELTVTAAVPVDVKVTDCVAGVFNPTLPNPTLVALMLSVGPAAAMVSVKVALPVPAPLVALSVTVDVPAAVGVPEINPEEVFTVRPVGKLVAP
jgi:hypothetical protein